MAISDHSKSVKPDKFTGVNYKRWANQMRYWLTTLGLISAIDSYEPSSSESQPSNTPVYGPQPEPHPSTSGSGASSFSSSMKPEDISYHCYHRILSALADNLYDIYYEFKSAKDLWNALEAEYGGDDAGILRFTSSSFNKFTMVDDKPMNEQIHEFQDFIRHLQSKGNTFSDDYKVSCLIDKLPPSWSRFAGDLRHKQGDLTLTEALKAIRIEDQHRQNSKTKTEMKAKVNLVEDKPKSRNFKPKGKKFKKFQQSFNKSSSKPNPSSSSYKSDGKFCYVCGRTNHLAPNCFFRKKEPAKPAPKGNGSNKVNMIEENPTSFRLASPSFLVNSLTSSSNWYLDSGANIHVCNDRSWFSTYQESCGGSISLADNSTKQIMGSGRIELTMTSGKTLNLQGVHHVPSLRRNLISESLLLRAGYRIVKESNKFVITKSNVFVGKGFICNGLFKLNVINSSSNEVPEIPKSSVAQIVESCDVWHGRLGHVNFQTLQRMIKFFS